MPPIAGDGTYSLPAGYLGVAGTPILVTQHNPIFEDVRDALTACVKRNGAGAMTGLLTLSGDPSTAMQAATKQYVDAAALAATAALDMKPSVLCATTANVTLSGEQTIDGQLTAASRVLVKNQTAAAENGIYLTGAGAWARVTDMDAWTELPGAFVAVEVGTIWADTQWLCTVNAGGTINSTAVTFRRVDSSLPRNAQTGTSYTVTTDDHGCHLTFSNAAAVAVTQPQATTTFAVFHGFYENIGAGTVTITPTTSTINGAATLVLLTGQWALIDSDKTNYRALKGGVPDAVAKTGALVGLTLSRTNATTYGIATGYASNEDSGSAFDMTLASAFTKTLSAWAAGTGNGSLDTGAIGASGWYHVHMIRKTADGSIDFLLSLAASAVTMPTGYVARRRIGSILTNGSSQIVAFSQSGDEVLWDVAVVDRDTTNPGTSAISCTLTTPTGVRTTAILTVGWFTGTNDASVIFSSLDMSDQAPQDPATGALTGFTSLSHPKNASSTWRLNEQRVRTNTSSQVRARANLSGAADHLGIITRGWVDPRGKQ